MKRIIAGLGVILGLIFVLSYWLAPPRPSVVLADDNEDDSNDDKRLWGLAGLFGLAGLSMTASDCRRRRAALSARRRPAELSKAPSRTSVAPTALSHRRYRTR